MASISDFLQVRGVPEEAISFMEDQKVRETICVVLVPRVAHVLANMHTVTSCTMDLLKDMHPVPKQHILQFHSPFGLPLTNDFFLNPSNPQ